MGIFIFCAANPGNGGLSGSAALVAEKKSGGMGAQPDLVTSGCVISGVFSCPPSAGMVREILKASKGCCSEVAAREATSGQ
jgi:hypothetical protein